MISLALALLFTVFHPFYVAVWEFNYNFESNRYELTGKFFLNDVEEFVFRSPTQLEWETSTWRDSLKKDQQLVDYVTSEISFFTNEDQVKWFYLGKEIINDQAFIYLESDEYQKPKQVSLQLDFLTDYLSDQLNIVYVTVGDKKRNKLLSKEDNQLSLTYE